MSTVGNVIFPNVPIPITILGGTPWWVQNIVSAVVGALIASAVGWASSHAQVRKQLARNRNNQFNILFTELYTLSEQIHEALVSKDKSNLIFLSFSEIPQWNTLRPLLPAFIDAKQGTDKDVSFIKTVDGLQNTARLLNSIVRIMGQSALQTNDTLTTKCRSEINEILKQHLKWDEDTKKAQSYIHEQLGYSGF